MKKVLFIILLGLIFISCNSHKKEMLLNLQMKESELELTIIELKYKSEHQSHIGGDSAYIYNKMMYQAKADLNKLKLEEKKYK